MEIETIGKIVCDTLGITEEELKSKCRKAHIVRARRIFCDISSRKNHTSVSTGNYLNKCHTTVLYHIGESLNDLRYNEKYFNEYKRVNENF